MNGIATITISGQKVGLKFGMPAIRQIFEKDQQYHFLSADGHFSELGIAHVLYAGYVNEQYRCDKQPALEFKLFYDYVEAAADTEESKAEVTAAIKAFEDSREVKELADKKKALMQKILESQNGTISSPSATAPSDSPQTNTVDSPGENTSLPSADMGSEDQGSSSTPGQ